LERGLKRFASFHCGKPLKNIELLLAVSPYSDWCCNCHFEKSVMQSRVGSTPIIELWRNRGTTIGERTQKIAPANLIGAPVSLTEYSNHAG
jgi:hypothetical protein